MPEVRAVKAIIEGAGVDQLTGFSEELTDHLDSSQGRPGQLRTDVHGGPAGFWLGLAHHFPLGDEHVNKLGRQLEHDDRWLYRCASVAAACAKAKSDNVQLPVSADVKATVGALRKLLDWGSVPPADLGLDAEIAALWTLGRMLVDHDSADHDSEVLPSDRYPTVDALARFGVDSGTSGGLLEQDGGRLVEYRVAVPVLTGSTGRLVYLHAVAWDTTACNNARKAGLGVKARAYPSRLMMPNRTFDDDWMYAIGAAFEAACEAVGDGERRPVCWWVTEHSWWQKEGAEYGKGPFALGELVQLADGSVGAGAYLAFRGALSSTPIDLGLLAGDAVNTAVAVTGGPPQRPQTAG